MADIDWTVEHEKTGHKGHRRAGMRMAYALACNGYSYPEAVQRIKWGRRVTRYDVSSATLKKLVKNGWLKLTSIRKHGHIRHSCYVAGDGPTGKPRKIQRPVRIGRKHGGANG